MNTVAEDNSVTNSHEITALFLDIGGVLLENGWDLAKRRRAAEIFDLDADEMNERHHLTFDTYEEGKLNLDEYLDRVVFFRERTFSRDDFKSFMFLTTPYRRIIDLVCELKAKYGLKAAVLSNEGRELAARRIHDFDLTGFIDFFIVSGFVHLRKPDEDIYRLALDVAQVPAGRVVYVEDRAMFVEVARKLGIRAIHHTGYASTLEQLEALGLSLPKG